MGNSIDAELRNDEKIASMDNLKQIPYIDAHQPGKKRPLLFSVTTWRKLIESWKRQDHKDVAKNNDMITPNRLSRHKENLPVRHSTGLPACQGSWKKSKPLYVIGTKPLQGIGEKMIDTKSVLQQPQTIPYRLTEGTMPSIEEQYKCLSAQQARLSAPNIKEKIAMKQNTTVKFFNDFNKQSAQVIRCSTHSGKSPVVVKQSRFAPRKLMIQASTVELLECLGVFLCRRCRRVPDLEPRDVGSWLRGVDRSLLMQGWQDITFIMPSSVVFVYMLCREIMPEDVGNVFEVQCVVLTCLYMSYSYMGNEISYPLRPFLIEQERGVFWGRCCRIMNKMSGKMLRINSEAQFFTAVFRDLKGYSPIKPEPPPAYVNPIASQFGNKVPPIAVGAAT